MDDHHFCNPCLAKTATQGAVHLVAETIPHIGAVGRMDHHGTVPLTTMDVTTTLVIYDHHTHRWMAEDITIAAKIVLVVVVVAAVAVVVVVTGITGVTGVTGVTAVKELGECRRDNLHHHLQVHPHPNSTVNALTFLHAARHLFTPMAVVGQEVEDHQ